MRVEDRSKEVVPRHLKDKIHFEQDGVPMDEIQVRCLKRQFHMSCRSSKCMPMMPYSTALYFTKVQEILTDEMNKELR